MVVDTSGSSCSWSNRTEGPSSATASASGARLHMVGRQADQPQVEWPDWTPPPQMLLRRPDLPRHMAGGPDDTHSVPERSISGLRSTAFTAPTSPSTIGHNVSSGSIRMMNEDVIDLYNHVPVGAKVVVL